MVWPTKKNTLTIILVFAMLLKKIMDTWKNKKNMHVISSGCDCHWAAVIAIGPKKREKPKMSCMPSGLAMVAIGQKKGKNKKCHAHRLVYTVWCFLVVVGNSFRCYLPTIPVVVLCHYFGCGGKQFWIAQISFLVAVGNSFRCYLLLICHTSCAVVSVFWLRQEIVFGCKVSKKDSYLVSSIERESTSKCCVYFIRSNTLLLCISLLSIYLLYHQIHRLTDQIIS